MKIRKLLAAFLTNVVLYIYGVTTTKEGQKTKLSSLFKTTFKKLFLQGSFHLLVESKISISKSYSNFYRVLGGVLAFPFKHSGFNIEAPEAFFEDLEELEDKYQFLKALSYFKTRLKTFEELKKKFSLKELLVEPQLYLGFEIEASGLYQEAFQLYTFSTCLENLIFSQTYILYKKRKTFRRGFRIAVESFLNENLKYYADKSLDVYHNKTSLSFYREKILIIGSNFQSEKNLDLRKFFFYSLKKRLENKVLSTKERIEVSQKKLDFLIQSLFQASSLEMKETVSLFEKFKNRLASEIRTTTEYIEEKRREGDFVHIRNNVVLLMEAMRDLFPLLNEPVNDLSSLWSIDRSRDAEDFEQAEEIEGALKMKDLLFKFYCYNKMSVDNLLLGYIDRCLLKLSITQRQKVIACFKKIILFLLKIFPYKLVALLLGIFLSDDLADSWVVIFNSWKKRFHI